MFPAWSGPSRSSRVDPSCLSSSREQYTKVLEAARSESAVGIPCLRAALCASPDKTYYETWVAARLRTVFHSQGLVGLWDCIVLAAIRYLVLDICPIMPGWAARSSAVGWEVKRVLDLRDKFSVG
jgi:hypothetical protein